MKKKSGKGKMRALAMLLAVVLVVTGINLPFSVGSLQVAAKENETGEVQEQNLDEPDTGDSVITELTLEGSGTEEDPYKIASEENLKNFQAYVNSGGETKGKYFSMTDTIEVRISGDSPWEPVGTKEHPFEGTFQGVADGSKYLYIFTNVDAAESDVALFGVNNGTVQELFVGNGSKTPWIGDDKCTERAAGIAITNNGTIRHCMVNGRIKAKKGAAGIAFENNGRIEDCQVGKPSSLNTISSDDKKTISTEPYGGIVEKIMRRAQS